jgi:hypothetical protein
LNEYFERSRLQRYADGDPTWWMSLPKPKTRVVVKDSYTAKTFNYPGARVYDIANTAEVRETIQSYNLSNLWYPRRGREGRAMKAARDHYVNLKKYGNVGSPLYIRKTSTVWEVGQANRQTNTYSGRMVITGPFLSDVPALNTTDTAVLTLQALGATAISRTIPTNPNASLATFLGELKQDLPSIPTRELYKNKTRDLMGTSGSEYLNIEFGWKPMISDLQKFAHSVKNSRKLLEQFVKASDKKIKRAYSFPKYQTTTVTPCRMYTGSISGGENLIWGTCTDTTTIDTWFSGAFRYHVPNGNSALEQLKALEQKANYLLGTRIDPTVLWNLAPWSWMADWFTNTGDIVNNITRLGSDGLVLQYGYLMETRKTERVLEMTLNGRYFRTRITYVTKRRIPATPYGFGIDMNKLTAKQWSILIALGVSRGAHSQ